MTEGVFNCLIDRKRTLAFRNAIKKTVRQGNVVADMGTGSGILAMFAADAGAKRVYAIENDQKNFRALKDTISLNGYEEIITLIKGDATTAHLPEKVDVIIGEMIATALIEELQIPAMNNMLKFGKRGCRILLKAMENYADLVYNNNKYYGKSLPIVRYEYPDEKRLWSKPLTQKVMYLRAEFTHEVENVKVEKEMTFEICGGGVINGLRLSSKTFFWDGSSFDSSFAYCYPIILPINKLKVSKGDKICVRLSYNMCEGFRTLRYSVGVGLTGDEIQKEPFLLDEPKAESLPDLPAWQRSLCKRKHQKV